MIKICIRFLFWDWILSVLLFWSSSVILWQKDLHPIADFAIFSIQLRYFVTFVACQVFCFLTHIFEFFVLISIVALLQSGNPSIGEKGATLHDFGRSNDKTELGLFQKAEKLRRRTAKSLWEKKVTWISRNHSRRRDWTTRMLAKCACAACPKC